MSDVSAIFIRRTVLKHTICILVIFLACGGGIAGANWTWHNPAPAGNGLMAVATDHNGTYIMAGDGGYLLNYQAGVFSTPDFNTFERVHDLELTADGGIAACERADVLIRSGGIWTVDRPATTAWFYGAAVTPGGDYFVCGDAGEIHRYSAGTWEELNSNTSSTLKDIDMVSDTRGWAVGLFGTVRVWNGTSWQYYSSQTSRFLRSVSGNSETSAWAVGDLGTITRWTGSGFQLETGVNSENLYDVQAVSDDEAWAVGENGTVLHRTGGVWSAYTHPTLPADIDYQSISVTGPSEMMIVGQNGTIMEFDGSVWTPLKNDALAALNIYDVLQDSVTGNVLLAGERGKVYAFDGVGFNPQVTGSNADLYVIREDPSGFLWSGGAGGLLIRDAGSGWLPVSTGDTEDIRDIDFLPEGDIWTAGGCDDGSCVSWAVLHYDGSDWIKYGESGS